MRTPADRRRQSLLRFRRQANSSSFQQERQQKALNTNSEIEPSQSRQTLEA
jgi:hypothetical protein